MAEKLKILLIIDDASMGGGQKHLLLLAQNIDKSKFSVEVACEEKGFLVDELTKINIPVHPIKISNWPSLKSFFTLAKIIHNVNPFIIHSHGGTAGFYSRICSLTKKKIGVVHTYHGIHYLNFEKNLSKYIFRFIDRALLPLTDRIICVAKNDFDLGLRNGVLKKDKSAIIKNGINIEQFASENIPADQKENIIVGSVGRLHTQKGYEFLIKSAGKILDVHPNVRFVIAGDGEIRNELSQLTKSAGVENYFTFLGNQNDIPAILKQFDIFVLPSLWEGLPLVLLEAMAAKKPIIATGVNGISEIIESGKTGILVPPRDSEKLADAINRMIDDGDLRKYVVNEGFKKVNEEFNVVSMVKKTEELYLSIYRVKS